jgi:hypothetical protein
MFIVAAGFAEARVSAGYWMATTASSIIGVDKESYTVSTVSIRVEVTLSASSGPNGRVRIGVD